MPNAAPIIEGVRLRSGRYELQRRLGVGAAATVWLAHDTLLGRPVAVKVLAEGLIEDRSWLARFRREARIAARLQHPNLVSVYDFDADVERPYLVMAYLSGGSLQDRLDNGGAPDTERLAIDLLNALAHIHAADIVHRDVKPGNVLLARDGRACLTDFGVARPQDATAITQTGQIPGTARYMAPELWRGEPADERSDLFACGVVLSECLDDDAPAGVTTLTQRLSAENPELRPASAEAALEMLGAPEPSPTTATATIEPPPPREPLMPSSGAPRWVPVAALCAVALLAGVVLANGIGGGDEPNPPAQSADQAAGGGAGEKQAPAAEPPGDAPAEQSPPPAEPVTDSVALNDQGFELIQQGRYDEAIPILEQAVDGFPDGTTDINYAYALFNLGNALRLAGRPEEAIPILEQRLEIPNQQSAVKAELKQAKKDLKAQEKAAKGDD